MRTVNVRLLKDGSGRICIHWFVRDPVGKIRMTPEKIQSPPGALNSGRIACNPRQNTVLPQQAGDETRLCVHSDDVRAVTCPECMGTEEFKQMREEIDHLESTSQSADSIKALQPKG